MAERGSNSSTEIISELFKNFIQNQGRPGTLWSAVEKSINGCAFEFEMDPCGNLDGEGAVKVSSVEGNKRLEFHFDKNGLYYYGDIYRQIGGIGAGYYPERKNLPSNFRELSIPLIMWSMKCYLQNRFDPIPGEVLEKISSISSAMEKK